MPKSVCSAQDNTCCSAAVHASSPPGACSALKCRPATTAARQSARMLMRSSCIRCHSLCAIHHAHAHITLMFTQLRCCVLLIDWHCRLPCHVLNEGAGGGSLTLLVGTASHTLGQSTALQYLHTLQGMPCLACVPYLRREPVTGMHRLPEHMRTLCCCCLLCAVLGHAGRCGQLGCRTQAAAAV